MDARYLDCCKTSVIWHFESSDWFLWNPRYLEKDDFPLGFKNPGCLLGAGRTVWNYSCRLMVKHSAALYHIKSWQTFCVWSPCDGQCHLAQTVPVTSRQPNCFTAVTRSIFDQFLRHQRPSFPPAQDRHPSPFLTRMDSGPTRSSDAPSACL